MKPIIQYDSSKEDLIDRYICEIDKNPIICTNPLEETSYLGLHYNKNRGFYRPYFKGSIKEYKDYIQEFVQSNQSSPESYEYVDTTLTWLLNKFNNAHKQFTNSPLRNDWRLYRQMPEFIETEIEEGLFYGKVNTKREAYNFFASVSGSQKYFLKELIDFIIDQLLPIKLTYKAITPFKIPVVNVESEIVCVFELTKTATKDANTILNLMHTGLEKSGYINCSSRDFKKLFIDFSYDKPQKSPLSIIWHCKSYNHLAYFIKCLITNDIITQTKSPSNYKIAIQLFNDRIENNFYTPRRERYDNNLNPKDRAQIDSIIKKSKTN